MQSMRACFFATEMRLFELVMLTSRPAQSEILGAGRPEKPPLQLASIASGFGPVVGTAVSELSEK